MSSSLQALRLNKVPFNAFKPLFAALEAPALEAVHGRYTAALTGPRWLQMLSRVGLTLGGLRGWCGKWFDGAGRGYNLVQRGDQIARADALVIRQQASWLDGRESLTVIYPPGSRLPWRFVVDEMRVLDMETLLCMMVVPHLGLHRLGFPFLLQAGEEAAGFPVSPDQI